MNALISRTIVAKTFPRYVFVWYCTWEVEK